MKHIFASAFVALYLAYSPAQAANEAHAPVAAPDIVVGDSWTYQYTDVWKKLPGNLNRVEVTAVDATGIQTEVHRAAGNALLSRIRLTREMNPVDRGRMHFSPAFARYAFPLEPGKEWSSDATGENRDAGKRWRFQINGKAGDWEKITVAAGQFDAIKIVIVGYYSVDEVGQRGGNGRLKETLWYAPSAKNFVKMEYEDTDGQGRIFNRDAWELTAVGVKP